ncbi:hypothetical protein MFLAVUS_008143 [Mucor flavus]|uniref:MIR domain-containing protein n=1 Tax=Mucor flavus TaxID=439312 RepID=A0ABP9Z6C7_9FUNG
MSDEDYNNGSSADGAIQYGNHISLKHNMSGRFLTAQDGNIYEEGSGQQKAYCGAWESSDETTFIVIPRIGSDAEAGADVNFGDVIRIKHMPTRLNLHSHDGFQSPVTGQQEVTCYGDDYTMDENDEWVVEQWTYDEEENEEFDVEDTTWYTGRSFFLRHVPTGMTLHSHDELLNDDDNEVTCFGDGPDENDRWRVAF